LLSRGAGSLLQYNEEIQRYAARMMAKGKHENLVRNNIKNKMLHMVCAVVKRGTPYIENYVSPYQQNVA
jgi:transposase